jgi:hypothetical protein
MDGPRASLNFFQRLILQWDKLHPYNAAQVLKLAGPAQAAALIESWQQTLSAMLPGLNGTVQAVPPEQELSDFTSQEMNRPFDRTAAFRAFILDRGDHHYAGIVYHHWAADSVSIRTLLREWFLRVYHPDRARREPLRRARGSPFGADRANWSVGSGLLSSLRWAARNRRVARVEHKGYADFSCRFALHEVGAGLVAPLLAYARRNNATLNDLFLAVAAEVCDRFVPVKKSSRRPDLALGTIVDLRPYSGEDLSETFGLFLGFTSTICRPEELANFPRLLQSIAGQSQFDKRVRVPLFSPLRMIAGLAAGKVYSRKKVIEFYRKRLPLAGGISNVNLNRSWPVEFHPDPLLDYIRVSPTGPMMPLVFTPTTLGDRLNLGFTYRPSLISAEKAAEMAGYFTQRLRALAASA